MATTASKSLFTVDADTATSTAIVDAVSAASGISPLELPPLYDAIDPDAVDALFAGRGANGTLQFRYADYVVTLTGNDQIELARD
ncbi:HalOD1 output domain-containing protein [Halogeometricum limi]|uniref:Halobacterial output domain-containing protein n=1 Tax=Halogeometricum limi TaxID=555875 RepID=A0A1I6HZI3_9EURY|nr:HalOD1 output domain-containing protein [Halogeometricum limi]SFR59804.1 hypothetical protein SAMN04488124_2633 [Halogeometricum limi]